MKNTLDAYIRFLSNFLSRNNYPEAEDLSFINAAQIRHTRCSGRRDAEGWMCPLPRNWL